MKPHPLLSVEKDKKFPETALILLKVIQKDYLQMFVSVFDIKYALIQSGSRRIHWRSTLKVIDELVVNDIIEFLTCGTDAVFYSSSYLSCTLVNSSSVLGAITAEWDFLL